MEMQGRAGTRKRNFGKGVDEFVPHSLVANSGSAVADFLSTTHGHEWNEFAPLIATARSRNHSELITRYIAPGNCSGGARSLTPCLVWSTLPRRGRFRRPDPPPVCQSVNNLR